MSREERRLFLKGMIALPLAAIFTNMDLLHAQAGKGEIIRADVNGSSVQAYLAKAENPDAPVVILIHEWWGLNDHIKAMAEEVSSKGFHALAIDLFQGSVATDRDGAMNKLEVMVARLWGMGLVKKELSLRFGTRVEGTKKPCAGRSGQGGCWQIP